MDRRQFLTAAALTPVAAQLASSAKGPEQNSPAIFPLVVGNTIPNQALHSGCYDGGLTQDQADTKFCHIVSRGIGGGQHLAVTKKFWNPSDWDTAKNNLGSYAGFGTRVIMALQPVLPGTGADKTNLKNFLATVKSTFGFNADNCYIVLWQEPEVVAKSISAADFQSGLQYYGPAVASAGLPLVADIGSGRGTAAISDYGKAAIAAYKAGCGLTGLAQDLYCGAYVQGVRLGTLANLADANGLGFGVFEHGCAPSQFSQAQCTTFMNHVRTFMYARQQAFKPNLPVLYYDGQCSATGEGDITSPIGQDPSTPSPDFRIALFQQLWGGVPTP